MSSIKNALYYASHGPLAQLVEQLTLNQVVPGSSPGRPTNPFSGSVAPLQSPKVFWSRLGPMAGGSRGPSKARPRNDPWRPARPSCSTPLHPISARSPRLRDDAPRRFYRWHPWGIPGAPDPMRRPSPTTPRPRSSFSVRGRTRQTGVPGDAAHGFTRGIHGPGRQVSASERMNCFAGTVVPLARNEGLHVVDRTEIGGWGRNRTGIDGFAGRCITTLPPSLGGYVGRGTRFSG